VNFKFEGVACPTGAEVTFGIDPAPGFGTPTEIAGAIGLIWGSTWREVQTSEVTLASVLVKFGPNATGPSGEQAINSAGTDTAGSVAPNTAVLVQKITADGGRAGRGRFFMPGIKESDVGSNGAVDPTDLEGWQTAADDFLEALDTATLPMVVLHGDGSPITTPSVVTNLIVSSTVATQRRRLRR